MTVSWLIFGVLAVAAAAFATWVYNERELPIAGRRVLAAGRGLILAIVLLLLWDPRVPGVWVGTFPTTDHWVLLDASASMGSGAGPEEDPWAAALNRTRELAAAGARVLLFGGIPRVVPTAALDTLRPAVGTSRLAPALARAAESGATEVTLLSDLRLDDPVESNLVAERLFSRLWSERTQNAVRNAGIARFELPARAQSGDVLEAQVAVFSEEAGTADTIRLRVYEEGRLVARTSVLPAGVGRVATTSIPLSPPRSSGWVRYRLSVELDGDEFAEDDTKTTFIEIDPEEGGLILVSFRPDWEPRFLLPVLAQVTGLDARGFMAMAGDRYLRMGAGAEAGESTDEAEVRRAAAGADLLVLHGFGGDARPWVTDELARSPRALLFPADRAGADAAGVPVAPPSSEEWYPVAELQPSPLASSLADTDLTGLPPLSDVLPRIEAAVGSSPLHLQLRGSGPPEAALVLTESGGQRRAVVLASGFWRWAFREGAGRQVYRRLWAGVVGWLFASPRVAGGIGVRPTTHVWSAWEEPQWRAPGLTGDSVSLTFTAGDSVVLDTTVVVDGAGTARTGRLPPGEYAFRATRVGESEAIGAGRVESESYSLEMFRRPAELPSGPLADSARRSVGDRPLGRPLRTHPIPYLLIIVLLSAEWIGRRSWGLR